VRGPASFCGIIGLRPTFGRIDIGGAMPLALGFDTVGWFARSIDVHERVGSVLLGEDVAGAPLKRMLVAEDAFALLFGEAERAALAPGVAAAARHLSAATKVTVAPEGLAVWQQLYRILQGFEAWAIHGPWITSRDAELGPQTATRFAVSSRVTAAEAADARQRRAIAAARVRAFVGDDGVLVLPSMPGIAPKVDAPEDEFEAFRARAISQMCIAGLAGLPQVSLPLAKVDGCPLGLSLIGPPGRDRALLARARAVLDG
jgi:amidase